MKIFLTNTITGSKEEFAPIDKNNIKMYVCGPTVYDRPHIGNARSSVVFDILFRLLKYSYPQVTYVRNITDVDDKIINSANQNNESTEILTARIIDYFHDDLKDLNCLLPTYEPKATENISEMIDMIERLIELGYAYVKEGHVYFDVNSYNNYGKLSKRRLDEQDIGARIEISSLKKNPLDFVLWKPKKQHEKMFFASPWGDGRPGWHIECSVMSKKYLGNNFDIHGGGVDLVFPHHENEIAQSICESKDNKFANYWVHNGFLTVNSEKMSKSLKNFITVKELLDKGIDGSVLRYFYLTANYRKPLDFNEKALFNSKKSINKFQKCIKKFKIKFDELPGNLPKEFLKYISDDLNTPLVLSFMHKLANQALDGNESSANDVYNCCRFLGLDIKQKEEEIQITQEVIDLAEKRKQLKIDKKWQEADKIRIEIEKLGYKVIDTKDGYKIKIVN